MALDKGYLKVAFTDQTCCEKGNAPVRAGVQQKILFVDLEGNESLVDGVESFSIEAHADGVVTLHLTLIIFETLAHKKDKDFFLTPRKNTGHIRVVAETMPLNMIGNSCTTFTKPDVFLYFVNENNREYFLGGVVCDGYEMVSPLEAHSNLILSPLYYKTPSSFAKRYKLKLRVQNFFIGVGE